MATTMSFSSTSTLYNPTFKYDLICLSSPVHPSKSSSIGSSASSLHKTIRQQRMNVSQHLLHHRHHNTSHPHTLTQPIFSTIHKKTSSTQLAGKLEAIMSSPLMPPVKEAFHSSLADAAAKSAASPKPVSSTSMPCTDKRCDSADYVYTAPCEHHPSKGQTDYLVNDMFPKLVHDLSTIEFGIRIRDFMPLAFKTVPVAGLAEKELQLLHGLGNLPNVIQLEDSFVNDNGDTVLVLPMLKKFEVSAFNHNICSVRKVMKQVLTGLSAVHDKNIVHLDINPSNLMVTHRKKDVVIIDFGLSQTVDRSCTSNKAQLPSCGTVGYIAPEVLHPSKYDACDPAMADIYSLGVVLGQLLEPYIPDCDLHYFGSKYLTVENTNQTIAMLKDFVAGASRYPSILVHAAELLITMLTENPNERKSAKELLESHPFLNCSSKLELCDWMCRVQEIKYQRYLYQENSGCEIYRYR
ncbi:hypothetical protein BGW42_001534 [Actinomortierella wolfii]|nr:hypothetical protein BGW42_001534 [Actinomortierella wolfii]